MSEVEKSVQVTKERGRTETMKRVGIYAAVALGIFLLGFLPVWLTARERTGERDEARHLLRISQTQNLLASAALDARRGHYEEARAAASDFFTNLRAEIDRPRDRAFTDEQADRTRAILLAPRDELIKLLALNHPAGANLLADLYLAYRDGVGAAR